MDNVVDISDKGKSMTAEERVLFLEAEIHVKNLDIGAMKHEVNRLKDAIQAWREKYKVVEDQYKYIVDRLIEK
jgi:hypothetical protein